MSDFLLATRVNPNGGNFPPQTSATVSPGGYFFGEASNDLQIGPDNDFTLINGLAETTQDVEKILLTEQGKNVLFPLYGTTLQTLIGNRVNPNVIAGTVQEQITDALQILFLLTQNRADPAEIVQTLYSLSTTLQNATTISSFLTVIAASGQEITTGIQIGNV